MLILLVNKKSPNPISYPPTKALLFVYLVKKLKTSVFAFSNLQVKENYNKLTIEVIILGKNYSSILLLSFFQVFPMRTFNCFDLFIVLLW